MFLWFSRFVSVLQFSLPLNIMQYFL